jgi:hypothetical protein
MSLLRRWFVYWRPKLHSGDIVLLIYETRKAVMSRKVMMLMLINASIEESAAGCDSTHRSGTKARNA